MIDDIVNWIQEWQIIKQGVQAASLEQRVISLEHQVEILQHVVLALATELRPDLLQQLAALGTPAQPAPFVAPASGWCVSRFDRASGLEVPLPPNYSTEDDARAEAQRLVEDDAQAQVYVTGSKGRRYRVLP